jgi:hypothetical protein
VVTRVGGEKPHGSGWPSSDRSVDAFAATSAAMQRSY